MSYLVGVDIGGTNIVCGLVDLEYNLLKTLKQPTDRHLGSDHVLNKLVSMIDELLVSAGVDRSQLKAVGAGIPGFVDPKQGQVIFNSNLGWSDLPVAQIVSEKLGGIPVFIDNDVKMYVFGEAMKGAGQGAGVVHGVTIGTGLAAATVANGELYYGSGYMAGELGHVTIDGEKTPCGCGLTGCLETVVSATGIARQAREALEAGRDSLLRPVFERDELTAAEVSKAYDEGDALAHEIMNYTGKVLGKGLAYSISLFSPDVVVIGGGGALAGDRLLKPMREVLERSVYKGYLERLTIKIGELIDHGGVIGSAAFANSNVNK
ncbi:sugar kinase [Paenibacillus selenitireducens]|uniref:Sugar kinase n=1 Tax=Paenibacillus selenitireducens TaxID=1324314 RepID=A0A1T2X1X9_9BACL|nr:ROK family protein [Paenibacillus selenitireducens]OPA73874.1 sugar kinase [Paenibacillus selenitireducens]